MQGSPLPLLPSLPSLSLETEHRYSPAMNILLLVAGTNEPSNSHFLAEEFEKELQSQGAETELIRLKDLEIDHFDAATHYDPAYEHEADFVRFQDAITKAHGVVIATPVWNFGVPAHLKNLMDRMGSFGLDETHSRGTLNGKPFYFLFTGGAPMPAWKGMMQKTTSFIVEGARYFGASPIGSDFEGRATAGRGKFDLVVHERPETIQRIHKKARVFAQIVRVYKETGKAPAKERARSAVMKFGERVMKKVFGG